MNETNKQNKTKTKNKPISRYDILGCVYFEGLHSTHKRGFRF